MAYFGAILGFPSIGEIGILHQLTNGSRGNRLYGQVATGIIHPAVLLLHSSVHTLLKALGTHIGRNSAVPSKLRGCSPSSTRRHNHGDLPRAGAWLRGFDYPPLFALLITTLIGFVRLELGHLFWKGKKLTGHWTLRTVVVYNQNGRWKRYALLVPTLVILLIAAYALAAPVDLIFGRTFFSWLPAWYSYGDLTSYLHYRRAALLVTFCSRIIVDGFIAPVTEELYFRGYLLPRISRLGWGAPFLNCFLFAVYHFWQPYNLPGIFCLCIPMVIGVWKTKDVRVSIAVHSVLNLIGAIGALFTVLRLH